jgi:hypothetical protein
MTTTEDEATTRVTLPRSKVLKKKKKKKKCAYTVVSASATSLLDQRRLVHLYPRIQHLPEMCNDGFIDMSSVRVNLCEKKKVHKRFEEIIEEGWIRTLSSVTFQP